MNERKPVNGQTVGLGCGTLIIIAILIVVFGRTDVDQIETGIEELQTEIRSLREEITSLRNQLEPKNIAPPSDSTGTNEGR